MGSQQKSKQHGKVVLEYTAEMKTCCGLFCTPEKIRTKVQELKDGDLCVETEAEEACNVQCCDEDCKLSGRSTGSA